MATAVKRRRASAGHDAAEDASAEFLALDVAAGKPRPTKRAKRSAAKTPSGGADAGEPSTSGGQPSRVMYIGNLPHGFYEKQLLGFFSQFGKVTHMRLSRNKKTGKARHYAFLEFAYPDVARIAAEAMNGYFLLKQRLTCKLLPADKVHPALFKNSTRKFKAYPWHDLERSRHEKERTPEEQARRIARLVRRDKQRQAAIRAAGIDYQYTGLKLPVQLSKIKIKGLPDLEDKKLAGDVAAVVAATAARAPKVSDSPTGIQTAVKAAQPAVKAVQPAVKVAASPVTAAQPIVKGAQPAVTPAVKATQPTGTAAQAALKASQPVVTTAQPAVKAAKPAVKAAASPVTAAQPIVTPAVKATQPTGTAAQAALKASQPVVTAAQPAVKAPKPAKPAKPAAKPAKPADKAAKSAAKLTARWV